MYINSISISELTDSLCHAFQKSDEQLYSDLSNIAYDSKDEDILRSNINKYVKENLVDKPDKVLLFHLSRRLDNDDNDLTGYSLVNLLTFKNSYSDFLLKHHLSFKYNNGHIDIYYYDKKVELDNSNDNDLILMKRLGYNKNIKDFCFNGFIINPVIGKNTYISSLSLGSELTQRLADLINNKSMIDEYINKSTYYCFKYLVPIDIVLFDENPTLNKNSKIIYMMSKYIDFFITYFIYQQREKTSTDIEIRLNDYEDLSSEYYIDKIIIEK